MAPADRRKESIISDYFDYMELKIYVYGLYKDGVWESLSQEIKCLYWRDLKRLWRRTEAGMDTKNTKTKQIECDACILGITPDIDQCDCNNNDNYPDRGYGEKYKRPLSLERAYEELGYEPADSFSVEDYIIQQEINQELYVAIKTLDEQKQRIIELYYFEEQTEREIGDNIGKAQRTVNYQKDKSHKELKKIMRKLF